MQDLLPATRCHAMPHLSATSQHHGRSRGTLSVLPACLCLPLPLTSSYATFLRLFPSLATYNTLSGQHHYHEGFFERAQDAGLAHCPDPVIATTTTSSSFRSASVGTNGHWSLHRPLENAHFPARNNLSLAIRHPLLRQITTGKLFVRESRLG